MARFLTREEEQRVIEAIRLAEAKTSGEIRVHVQKRVSGGDIMHAAKHRFDKLGMSRTELRNGVLIFVATDDRELAIIGDKGINELVQESFWDDTVNVILGHFKAKDFIGGIVAGIETAGKALQEYFPRKKDDKNELSDEVSFEA
ncbi:MAG: hypothetical protein A2X49_05810 [Lentisphaerae bacterium GWF2_52_8]|nr:MAG: hypothetical protein A2X49_05810 [Lentisphaerae bacterium GWF2_52_8]